LIHPSKKSKPEADHKNLSFARGKRKAVEDWKKRSKLAYQREGIDSAAVGGEYDLFGSI
jgi:hypothetical protein